MYMSARWEKSVKAVRLALLQLETDLAERNGMQGGTADSIGVRKLWLSCCIQRIKLVNAVLCGL